MGQDSGDCKFTQTRGGVRRGRATRGLTLDKGGGSSLFPKEETAEVPKKVVSGRPSKDLLIGYYFLLISF